ncbi:Transcription regulator [Alkalibacterium sp. AK22]|uniref:diacylglycerol/lipid kinase family protein n=1 Tax=Alkalibacterium sp. AK22 TaxID=1229520 RepID=UPI0004515662|nr:diacylglycerol kinase family protein [Alkalibacterium sp. AK22]EXJ22809.1 Transcription regulator [Alkalibacterium sp. AK22]
MEDVFSHLVFIVNEHSRRGRQVVRTLRKLMKAYNYTYGIYRTEYPGHAAELAEVLSKEYSPTSLLIAVGGDGTLNEVINGVITSLVRRPVSYIPTGSGNDFARSHDLSRSIEMTLKRILLKSAPVELDVLFYSSDAASFSAVNSFGFGVDGMVIRKLEENQKKQHTGKFAYLLSVLSAFFEQQSFSLTLKTNTDTYYFEDALLVVCCNHKFFGGGIPIQPLADPADGLLDIVVAEKVTFVQLLHILYKLLTKESHLNHPKLHSYRVSSCSLHIDPPQYGQRDGELIKKNVSQIQVKTLRQLFWL